MLVNVQFHVTCAAEDPQAPARVLGILAARSLPLMRFFAERTVLGTVEIEIMFELAEGEGAPIEHLARLLARLPSVRKVGLLVNGRPTPFQFAVRETNPVP